jgi:hypothetical protein
VATKVNASDVVDLLQARYSFENGWGSLREVSPPGSNRRFDAVAFTLWKSAGVVVHGFEVKVSRSDWLSELRNPAKSETLASFCDHWWIVAPPEVAVKTEVPEPWGLLTVVNGGLRQVRTAPKRKPLRDEAFWQFLVARCVKRSDVDAAAERRVVANEVRAGMVKVQERVNPDRQELQRLLAEVDAFEKASGIKIRSYKGSGERAAGIAKLVASGEARALVSQMASARNMLKNAHATTEKAAALLKGLDQS